MIVGGARKEGKEKNKRKSRGAVDLVEKISYSETRKRETTVIYIKQKMGQRWKKEVQQYV